MGRYIVKRGLLAILIMFLVSIIVFFTLSLSSGDVARMILGPKAPESQVQQFEEKYGLDKPVIEQYADYMMGVFQGDFGESYRTGKSITSEIASALPKTLTLAFTSLFFTTLLAIPLGTLMALKQHSIFDNSAVFIVLIISALPEFLIGLILMLIFSANLGWLPSSGASHWYNYIMPVASSVILGTGGLARFTKSVMLDALGQDYIQTARAKGASERRVIVHHILKNALIPILTMVGINASAALGGAVILESLFSIPGLGMLSLNAINTKDMPLVMGCVLLMSLFYSVITLIIDILYSYIDPRIKAEYSRKRKRVKTA